MSRNILISVVTDDIEAIGAKVGQYVLDDGGPVLCVMHEVPREKLNDTDRAKLTQVGVRTRGPKAGAA